MLSSKCLSRATLRAPRTPQSCRNITNRARPAQVRTATHPYAQRRQQHFVRSVATVTVLGAAATAYQWANGGSIIREVHAEEPPKEDEVELKFEEPRRRPKSADDNRNIISSQHLQVLKSWENPGVYTWGSNAGKVVAPDSDEKYIKTPRRISYFDGKLLRDIKLDRDFGAAIDERGDLLQWGVAFSKDVTQPTKTLRGQNLTSLKFSRDRIIALSSGGTVYSIPVSRAEQKQGPKPTSKSWIPFWNTSNDISYRTRTPGNLGWTERVTDIASGLEHALMLTSSGRVFSFASGTQDFPTKGQLGIPGISFENRPAGPFDMPHEITTLKGFPIKKIAAGDYHSLVCDSDGRAFTFGDNTAGQLGFPFNAEATYVDAPSLLPTQKLYAGSASQAKVSNVFAGGNTSFLTIDATKADQSRTIADTWAFGFGLTGQLGVGRWIHTCADPVKVPAFSGLFEWDEKAHKAIPIRLNTISVGATHAAAVMDNVASVLVSDRTRTSKLTDNDTNWGRDILFWGNNGFYQIGSGKRSNVATPTYIQPLDQSAELERAASVSGIKAIREKEMHRFQITPRQKVRVNGRMVEFEQKVECGRGCTAVYSAV